MPSHSADKAPSNKGTTVDQHSHDFTVAMIASKSQVFDTCKDVLPSCHTSQDYAMTRLHVGKLEPKERPKKLEKFTGAWSRSPDMKNVHALWEFFQSFHYKNMIQCANHGVWKVERDEKAEEKATSSTRNPDSQQSLAHRVLAAPKRRSSKRSEHPESKQTTNAKTKKNRKTNPNLNFTLILSLISLLDPFPEAVA